MVESARSLGIHVEIIPMAWWWGYEPSLWHYKNALVNGPRCVRSLRRLFQRLQIDLVHTNTSVIYAAALAARRAGLPHVWHVHEVLTPLHTRPRMLPLEWIMRRVGRWSDRVIFESHSARACCDGIIDEGKTRVVYNSVRFAGQEPGDRSQESGDRGPGSGDGVCTVVWVGQLRERKNPLMLIRAIPRMQHAAACRFVLAGEGPLKAEVEAEIDRQGLGRQCTLLPFQGDVRPLLQSADVLALTSREESFGLVLVEAAAYGVPSIATRTQGPTEIVVDGETGLLVESDDESALAAALDRLATEVEVRRAMGGSAKERANDLFSAKKNTRRIEEILDEVSGQER